MYTCMLRRNSGSDLRTLNGNSAYGCALVPAGGDAFDVGAAVGVAAAVSPTVAADFGARLDAGACAASFFVGATTAAGGVDTTAGADATGADAGATALVFGGSFVTAAVAVGG